MMHALDRIRERLTPQEQARATAALPVLNRFPTVKDFAVRLFKLQAQRNERWGEVSNGDEVWAIVRRGRVQTVMLRRSTQPATPESLRVDVVIVDLAKLAKI